MALAATPIAATANTIAFIRFTVASMGSPDRGAPVGAFVGMILGPGRSRAQCPKLANFGDRRRARAKIACRRGPAPRAGGTTSHERRLDHRRRAFALRAFPELRRHDGLAGAA